MCSSRLGIAMDHVVRWHIQFEQAARSLGIDCEIFHIEQSNWLDKVAGYDAVLWRPNLDAPYLEEAREKIYFIERVMGKRVMPNWDTFWHYNNKRAQAYLLMSQGIPTPKTFISYSRCEAMSQIDKASFPLVSKCTGGASSEAVRLLRTPAEARRMVRRVFDESLFTKALNRFAGVRVRWSSLSPDRYVLWQEFVPGNDRDFRVTIIGGKYGFVFWRANRPGDFRASGSGRIDYEVEDGREEVKMCLDICKRNNFDSMAFDLLYRAGEAVVVEMSYTFNAQAIYNAPGHFELGENGSLNYVTGHIWPQELSVRYIAEIIETLRCGPCCREAP